MKTSVLALSALIIGISVALSVKAAHQTIDRPTAAIVVQPEELAAGWRVEAALQQEPQTVENVRAGDAFAPRPIPADRLNIRRVGPSFFPDPTNALDLGR
jgi:hypothetical protein